MTIEPKTQRKLIISAHEHMTGDKKEINEIKNNHLKHMHEDIDRLGGKIDRIYWVVLYAVGAVGLVFIETLLGML